jgi:hypothetical protein
MPAVPHIPFGDDMPTLGELEAVSTPISTIEIGESAHPQLPSPLVAVYLDPIGRPDLTDFVRAVRGEDQAGLTHANQWFIRNDAEPPRAFLSIRTERPVICSFMLEFRADQHRDALEALIQSGALLIMFVQTRPSGETAYPYFATVLSPEQRDYLRTTLEGLTSG